MSHRDTPERSLVLCIKNEGYEVDLQVGTIYLALPDKPAAGSGRLRIIDESGEDYLYPQGHFQPVSLSRAVENMLTVV